MLIHTKENNHAPPHSTNPKPNASVPPYGFILMDHVTTFILHLRTLIHPAVFILSVFSSSCECVCTDSQTSISVEDRITTVWLNVTIKQLIHPPPPHTHPSSSTPSSLTPYTPSTPCLHLQCSRGAGVSGMLMVG